MLERQLLNIAFDAYILNSKFDIDTDVVIRMLIQTKINNPFVQIPNIIKNQLIIYK